MPMRGYYLNPGTHGFRRIVEDEYVDKTGLIAVMNQHLNTSSRFLLISRPRRFGKSYAAAMLNAYYQVGYDNRDLFETREIARMTPISEGVNQGKGWRDFLNQYHVIYINWGGFKRVAMEEQRVRSKGKAGKALEPLDWIDFLGDQIKEDVAHLYGRELVACNLRQTLRHLVEQTGHQIIWICDEWDLLFREQVPDSHAGERYLDLLRALFEDGGEAMEGVFAGAYMTGIMPMLKVNGQSAVSAFQNYTMLAPRELAPYTGFTTEEVWRLCTKHDVDFDNMRAWYEGYDAGESGALYNPLSVRGALKEGALRSYWVETASYEVLKERIEQEIPELRETILRLLAGESLPMDASSFPNEIGPSNTLNDELTLLTHLGYLTYDPVSRTVRIPNHEIRSEFVNHLTEEPHEETMRLIRESDLLLKAVWNQEAEKVAEALQVIHQFVTDPKHYNNERDLTAVVRAVFFTGRDYYILIKELPGGRGYADLVFLPKRGSDVPLLVVELKWNKPVHGAIEQIRDKEYPQELKDFGGRVLLVEITYSTKTGKHVCEIEELER